MQQAVLIQCSYNAIQYLSTFLFVFLAVIFNFTPILIWYVILGVSLDGIYEIITYGGSLFWKKNYLHSNICQNLVFWRPFCFTLISQNANAASLSSWFLKVGGLKKTNPIVKKKQGWQRWLPHYIEGVKVRRFGKARILTFRLALNRDSAACHRGVNIQVWMTFTLSTKYCTVRHSHRSPFPNFFLCCTLIKLVIYESSATR